MAESTSLVVVVALALAGISLFLVLIVGVFVVRLFMKLESTDRTSSETAGKLDELVGLIKKVSAGEGGETQLGPAEPEEPEKETKPHEGDQDGDLLWGDNAEWIEQEREKAGWKSRKDKIN